MENMLELSASELGHHFNHRWLFRRLRCQLAPAEILAVLGPNGSGKSTLLSLFAGQRRPIEGTLSWKLDGRALPPEQVYRHLAWSGPFTELYPDLSLAEAFRLHFRFKSCLLPSRDDCLHELRLQHERNKPLKYFSSGMLQRAKLGLALFTDSALLMLDEPTSFMDSANARFSLNLIEEHRQSRTTLLASNLPREVEGIRARLSLPAA